MNIKNEVLPKQKHFNPPMVKPFRLTYLAKGGGGGGWLPPPSLNLNHCLSDLLLTVFFLFLFLLALFSLQIIGLS